MLRNKIQKYSGKVLEIVSEYSMQVYLNEDGTELQYSG